MGSSDGRGARGLCGARTNLSTAERSSPPCVGKKADLVVADFSTTGPVERAASEVVLFDAFQSYFEYDFMTMCGIPQITLLGTAEDWLRIRRRAEVLAEFDLTAWTTALLPVLDGIVRTAQGHVDREFWESLYKRNNASGGPYVTGWINLLFPYVKTNKGTTGWNKIIARWRDGMSDTFGGGPTMEAFPKGLSSAPFSWDYRGTKIPMVLTGGFTGISQEAATGAVRPAIGWAIGEQ